jgi:myo-inositol-1(or 4)-monophosphatase
MAVRPDADNLRLMTLSDLDLAIAAAEAGAAIVRSKYGTQLTRIAKSALDFATDADVAAEVAIMAVLHAARPDDRIVGEESGAAHRGSSERTWLIDPLCGTLNYAAQTPLVVVNVALRTDNQTTVAVCADPLAGEVMWTDGTRAYLRRDSRDELLRPSSISTLVDVNLDGPYPNAERFSAIQVLATPGFADLFQPRVTSTTLALAWVAAGRRAGYLTDGNLRDSVHFTSAIALCEAAGCVVTGLLGQPPHTGVGGLLVGADEATHTALLALIARQFAARSPS